MTAETSERLIPTWSVVVSLLFLLLSPLWLVLLLPFVILRLLTYLIYLFYGSRYMLMDSTDVFWCLDSDKARSVISILMVVDYAPRFDGDTLLQSTRELVAEAFGGPQYWKFWAKRARGLLYHYWIRGEVNPEAAVLPLPDHVRTKEEVEDFLADYSNKDSERGLAAYTGSQQIEGGYPVIFLIHHSSGDGNAMLKALVKSLSRENKKHKVVTRKSGPSTIELLSAIPAVFVRHIFFKDTLAEPPSGQRIAVSRIISAESVEKIKQAKTRNDGIGFVGVLLYAAAEGLKPLLKKLGRQEQTTKVCITIAQPSKDMSNRFSLAGFSLPIDHPRVPGLQAGMPLLVQDMLLHGILQKLLAFVPDIFLKGLFWRVSVGMIFSNLPGPEAVCLGEHALQSLTFWLPTRYNTGLGMSVLTYDSKLHLGLLADKSLIPERQLLEDTIDRIVCALENVDKDGELSVTGKQC